MSEALIKFCFATRTIESDRRLVKHSGPMHQRSRSRTFLIWQRKKPSNKLLILRRQMSMLTCELPSSEPTSIDNNGNRTLSLTPKIRVKRISCFEDCKPPSMPRDMSLPDCRIAPLALTSHAPAATTMTPALPQPSMILMILTSRSPLLHPLALPLILKLARQTDRRARLGWSSSSPQSDSPRFPLLACSSSSSARPAASLVLRLGS
jgi:hypothetical protein